MAWIWSVNKSMSVFTLPIKIVYLCEWFKKCGGDKIKCLFVMHGANRLCDKLAFCAIILTPFVGVIADSLKAFI